MNSHKPRLHELKILERLRKAHRDAPEEVLAAEARHRFEAKVFAEHKDGTPQVVLAKRYAYSVANVSRIIAAGRTAAEERIVAPLTVWQSRRIEQTLQDVKAAYDAEQAAAPKPEDAQAAIGRIQDALRENPGNEVSVTQDGHVLTGSARDAALAALTAPEPRVWHLIQQGNSLSLVEPPVPAVPEPASPTDADRYMFALVQDRSMLLGSAIRMLQLVAGIEATGRVDDETLSIVAGIAAWQGRPRPLLDAVQTFMAGRRRA